MTTPFAEALYLSQHLAEWRGKGYAVFNPHDKPIEDLPVIWGFNNGGSPGWYSGVLLADDGECLGGHCCSHEGYMPADLGVIEGSRPDRHETFRKHYPDGYRMDFVPASEAKDHAGLNAAYQRHQERVPDERQREEEEAEERRRLENEEMDEHFRRHPHG